MPTRTPVVLLVIVLMVALPASVKAAEPVQTVVEQIPASVVMRLLHIESPDQLMLGGIPEEVAERVPLPSDIQIVASVSYCCGDYSRHRVVASSSRTEADLRKALVDILLESGWKSPPSSYPETQSGFATRQEPDNDLTFCGTDDDVLSASISESDEKPTALELTLQTGYEYSPCSRESIDGHYGMISWAEDLVPVLEPPEGARSFGGGRGGSNEYAELSAEVETELSADALVEHYASQLVAAGWQAGQAAAATHAAVADIALSTPEGESVAGFLMAHCDLQEGFRCSATLRIFRER